MPPTTHGPAASSFPQTISPSALPSLPYARQPARLNLCCSSSQKTKCSHLLRASYVSPRKRAQRTFELLNLGIKDPLPWNYHGACPDKLETNHCNARVQVTEDVREWDCEFVLHLPLQSLKTWYLLLSLDHLLSCSLIQVQ